MLIDGPEGSRGGARESGTPEVPEDAGRARSGDAGPDGQGTRAWRVHGRVQGVGFRWWTERTGTRLGLRGWVRNCRDGTVEVRAAGGSDALDALRRALAEGPGHARVDRVEEVPDGGLSVDAEVPAAGFTIVR